MAQILSKRREVHLKLAILLVLSLTRCSTDDSEPAAPGMNLAPPPETTVMVDRGHHNSHHLLTTLFRLADILQAEGYNSVLASGLNSHIHRPGI